MKKFWRIWARTMGEKISDNGTEADIAAAIRTFWWFVHITTSVLLQQILLDIGTRKELYYNQV